MVRSRANKTGNIMWTRVHVQTEKKKYRHTLHIPLTKQDKLSKTALILEMTFLIHIKHKSHKNLKLKHSEGRKNTNAEL